MSLLGAARLLIACTLFCLMPVFDVAAVEVARVGLSSRAPTPEEKKSLGLVVKTRANGQIVDQLVEGGPADKAGLRIGDALLRFDNSEFYSFDDLRDYMAVAKPGQTVTVYYRRAGVDETQETKLTFGKGEVDAATLPKLSWHYAGGGQLDDALAAAKKANKPVLVALFGAET